MAKKGQHHNDANDKNVSKGPNNPSKSHKIITGSYKKHETYRQQAIAHKNTEPLPQSKKNVWNEDTRDQVTIEGSPRARKGDLSRRDEQKYYGPDAQHSRSKR